jgi:hypothetical protein
MTNLKLFLRDASLTGESTVVWNLPIMIGHNQVGMSSVQILFTDFWKISEPLLIPVECSLIKENMWNQSGVLFTLDIHRNSYESKYNSIG